MIYKNAADKFKIFEGIINYLGLTIKKFDKLLDESIDLPRSDVKKNAILSVLKLKSSFSPFMDAQ